MGTLIIHLDTNVSESEVKEALKKIKGISSVSDKITRSDFEALADDVLVREMKKADKGQLLSYEEGKKEFERIKKKVQR
jgi:copper chaperone CopZ